MPGEDEMLVSAVADFCSKVIDDASISIERDGISRETVRKIAEQGFLGLKLPPDKGGAGISQQTYLKMLAEFSQHSPSVAVLVMNVNSILLPLLSKSSAGEELIPEVVSGTMLPSIPIIPEGASGSPEYALELKNGKVVGDIPYIIGLGWNSILAGIDSENGELILIRDVDTGTREHARLGVRGLSFYGASIDSNNFADLGIKNSRKHLDELFNSLTLETAAIALGITEGSLSKALDYAKVRSTFEHLLKDYQPVAFSLTRLFGEKVILENFLLGKSDFTEQEKLYAKLVSIELAKNASRQSIQTHGGYGYLEDFGVEKYYRDSMALSVLFGNRIDEQKQLSDLVFESDSGSI